MSVINIFSPNWESADSYGRLARELMCGFQASDYHVNPFGDNAPPKTVHPAFGGLFLGYPTDFESYEHGYGILARLGPRVAITMFESSKLPDGWVENLNKCDAVIVPAKFLLDVFRGNGVLTSLSVQRLGISSEFLTRVVRREYREPLTFLAIADRGARKGWDKAMFAFQRAFGSDERYKLILKTRADSYLSLMAMAYPNIEVIAADYSNEELADLYHRCHVMLFPSCGEGFGLPPREFAATGGVVLATNWGGTADDLHEWGIPLPYKMGTAWRDKTEWYGKLGHWAEVPVSSLVAEMRAVAEDFDWFAEQAMKSAEFVHQTYQWSRFADGVERVWKQVMEAAYASAG